MKFVQKNKKVLIAMLIIILIGIYFIIEKAAYGYDKMSFEELESSENSGNSEELDSSKDLSNSNFSGEQKNLEDSDLENGENSDRNILENEENKEDLTRVGDSNGRIYVYITGEVNNSGVVILNEGSRISDAIDAAGGITSRANISKINLVYVLEDGMKVNIPNDNDLKENENFQYITMNSGDNADVISSFTTGRSSLASSGSSSSSNDGLGTNSSSGAGLASSSTGRKNSGIVNINSATQTELETLPGIGPSLALKIITFRNENGKFSSIEDIKNVSGIGESKFNNIKNNITV